MVARVLPGGGPGRRGVSSEAAAGGRVSVEGVQPSRAAWRGLVQGVLSRVGIEVAARGERRSTAPRANRTVAWWRTFSSWRTSDS
ncbi:MAG: hypothetical protein ACK559_23460 [bacterium]